MELTPCLRRSGITGIGHSPAMYFPRRSATLGEMCAIDVGFMPGVSVPRTSSNPGEIGVVELGCRTVLGFPRLIPPRASVARKSVTI